MPGVTGHNITIAQMAQTALNRPQGVQIAFRVGVHGSLEACKSQARSWQNSFTAMRARTRRRKSRDSYEDAHERDPWARVSFDDLVCQVMPMPKGEGYFVYLIPAKSVLAEMEVIDRATGERVSSIGNPATEIDRLVAKAVTHLNSPDISTFTAADWDRGEELQPGIFVNYPVARPGGLQSPAPKPFDLADLPMDVDPFTGERVDGEDTEPLDKGNDGA